MMAEIDRVAERLAEVQSKIEIAGRRSGRTPNDVRLVLATKTQPAEPLRAAYYAGAREFGENYVQEAAAKRAALGDLTDIRWHLIGHLQTNKAKAAVNSLDVIQSLDSIRLAKAIASANPRQLEVLIEVNIAREESKSGAKPEQVEPLIDAARNELQIQGLMAIPPAGPRPEDSRRWFTKMRELRDRLAASTALELSELSMGMTGDYEIAIEEGATIVRVGRAVFGERAK